MKFAIIGFICTQMMATVNAQSSDMLVLKKHGKTIRTFFPGNEVMFSTASGFYSGIITSINRDTVFLIQYDIRQRPSNLGVYFLDTVATYRYGIAYKQITGFDANNSKTFNWAGSGGALFGGGVLITTVGLGTWLFAKPGTRYYTSPYLVGSAALLAGIGYLLVKPGGKGRELGKKYSLEYINVK
ncbi:MAG: hypothetical protein M3Z56_12100 [Bacteroidota bacterium]|nr:hypothetical protein [Bacteroidota bacterium]